MENKKKKRSLRGRARYAQKKAVEALKELSEAYWAFKKLPDDAPSNLILEDSEAPAIYRIL